jgi:hypothetical protein
MLVLQPNDNGSPDDHSVMQGGWQIGRVYKRANALRPQSQWLWFITGMSRRDTGIPITGTSASQDEALAATQESWNKMLKWAQLIPQDSEPASVGGLRVLSVSISNSGDNDPQ